MRLLALIILLCAGCKSPQPAQTAMPSAMMVAAPTPAPTGPVILNFQLTSAPADSHLLKYDTAGRLNDFTTSNLCVSAWLTYFCPTNCFLWHNSQPQSRRTNYFSANPSDNVMTPGFVRVGPQLPAGTNTVKQPVLKDMLMGFFFVAP